MLGRSLQPLSFGGASRRAYYSVFSSKPGGGRYFNSAKPQKVSVPATPNANSKAAKAQGDEANTPSGPVSSPSATTSASSSSAILTPTEEASSSLEDTSPKKITLSAGPSQSNNEETPRLLPHPSFSAQTYPLHQFFALHRPLLHLPLPTASLFTSPDNVSAVFSPNSQQGHTELDGTGVAASSNGHSEADTARQIVRAMAIHRVGAMIDWSETLARLGDEASTEALRAQIDMQAMVQEESQRDAEAQVGEMQLESTRRKRRKKMSKHKLKKRRKATRAQRRRLGK